MSSKPFLSIVCNSLVYRLSNFFTGYSEKLQNCVALSPISVSLSFSSPPSFYSDQILLQIEGTKQTKAAGLFSYPNLLYTNVSDFRTPYL